MSPPLFVEASRRMRAACTIRVIIHAQRRQWALRKTRSREKRALSCRDFSRISREKSWSRTAVKLLGEATRFVKNIPLSDHVGGLSLSRWVSLRRIASYLFRSFVSPLWTTSEYSEELSCIPRCRDRRIQHASTGSVHKTAKNRACQASVSWEWLIIATQWLFIA